MKDAEKEIKKALHELPKDSHYGINPASDVQIASFSEKAKLKGVPQNVIDQLVELYSVANELSCLAILAFFSCTDDLIYKYWDENTLWLGQRDFNSIRWVDDKFCLGDAGDNSYSKEDEYDNLLDLIKACIKHIKDLDN